MSVFPICFICGSEHSCEHREPELRGWRSRAALIRSRNREDAVRNALLVAAQRVVEAARVKLPPVPREITETAVEHPTHAMVEPLEQARGRVRSMGESYSALRGW